ncbi:IS256 family transposase [Pontibacter qinzhouensis]|uniref:Mutator family transposase n=1 Tax=Pontibacter qinzhouensis TaxID=2603253 RepID=A0A5C8IND2_9BACT|nr:IS256 family transposase [Pontibacter qinzhouensis]TXK22475.1 IS256 family transposase [Pontibacter qinzhouensis]
MEDKNSLDLEQIKRQFLEEFRSGKPTFGKDGALGPLLKHFLEAALEAEMDLHLDKEERGRGNRRNGKVSKQVRTSDGVIELESSRDRSSRFEPQIIKKRETLLAENLEPRILSMYGLGMSFRDISSHLKEMYDMDISHDTLSALTEKIVPQVKEWQARPLDSLYCIVWLDAMHYKVRQEGRTVSKAVYNILGIDRNGYKELLGVYVSESEGATFWLSVLTDLQQRGVKDVLIACIDNLKGFAEAITSVFPQAEVQSCIVHQIRNSLKYVASKDQKEFMQDLQPVYRAESKALAELRLLELEEKWGKKYPKVIESWQRNWEKLSTYFKYTEPITRLVYTTNPIEGLHRQVRKVTKTKGAFPSDMALLKLIYLAHQNISRKWSMPLANWSQTAQQLAIWFGERMELDLK